MNVIAQTVTSATNFSVLIYVIIPLFIALIGASITVVVQLLGLSRRYGNFETTLRDVATQVAAMREDQRAHNERTDDKLANHGERLAVVEDRLGRTERKVSDRFLAEELPGSLK